MFKAIQPVEEMELIARTSGKGICSRALVLELLGVGIKVCDTEFTCGGPKPAGPLRLLSSLLI